MKTGPTTAAAEVAKIMEEIGVIEQTFEPLLDEDDTDDEPDFTLDDLEWHEQYPNL